MCRTTEQDAASSPPCIFFSSFFPPLELFGSHRLTETQRHPWPLEFHNLPIKFLIQETSLYRAVSLRVVHLSMTERETVAERKGHSQELPANKDGCWELRALDSLSDQPSSTCT